MAPLLVIKATKILRMRPALFRPNDSLRTTRTQVQPSLLIFLLSLYSTHRGYDHFSYVSFFLVFLVTRFFFAWNRATNVNRAAMKRVFSSPYWNASNLVFRGIRLTAIENRLIYNDS